MKSILSSESGDLEYWIRVTAGAKGQVVVAVGEAHWGEPGHRLMDILVDGRVCQSGIDPIVVAGGAQRVGTVLCTAEDLDHDGLLHVQVVAAKNSPDKVTLLAGLWWIAQGDLSPEQAKGLTRSENPVQADLFIPALPLEETRKTLAEKTAARRADEARQRQEDARAAVGLAKLPQFVRTEDASLNGIADKIFGQCIFSKLYDPLPPALPNRWFSPGGGYVGQWVWDTMFVLAAYAPMDEDAIVRGVFQNYWHTIAQNPEAPRDSYRYRMVPNFLKDWLPLGYSQIPILAWGVQRVYRQTHDRKLLEESLPYLDRYGYHELARRLTDRIVALTLKHGVNERYNGLTGQPLGVTGLGMSCSIWSMIVQNVYGVGDDFRTIRVPPGASGRKLMLGKLELRYPSDNAVELRSAFARKFQVIFPDTPGVALRQFSVACQGSKLAPDRVTVLGNRVSFEALPGQTYAVTTLPANSPNKELNH